MSSAFKTPPEQVYRSPVFKHVIDEKPQAYRNYLANRGSLITPWLSAYHPSRALVGPANTVLPEHILTGQAAVIRREYTPNRIEYEFEAQEAGTMMIGMGFDAGWRASDGRPLFDRNGLIAFDFQSGSEKVTLVYRTPWFWSSLFVSLLTVGLTAGLWRRWREESRIVADSNSG